MQVFQMICQKKDIYFLKIYVKLISSQSFSTSETETEYDFHKVNKTTRCLQNCHRSTLLFKFIQFCFVRRNIED